MDRQQVRKTARVVAVAAGIGIGLHLLLVLADIAVGVWVFRRMSTVLAGRGLNSDLAGAFGIAFAVFTAFAAHGVGWLLLTRKTHLWALRIGVIFFVWYAAMYAVSYQYSGGAFNVWTGQAQVKYYRDSQNRIITMPIGAKVGPEGQLLQVIDPKTAEERVEQDMEKDTAFNVFTGLPQFKYYRDSRNRIVLMPLDTKTGPEGQTLQVIDQKIAEEHKQQGGFRRAPRDPFSSAQPAAETEAKTDAVIFEEFMQGLTEHLIEENPAFFMNTPVNSPLVLASSEHSGLYLWTEKVQIAPDRTIVYLACRGENDEQGGRLFSLEESYLTDESGRVYDLLNNSTVYDGGWYKVRVDEVYHFALTFPALLPEVFKLRLHLTGFSPTLDLSYALANAEKIPRIPDYNR